MFRALADAHRRALLDALFERDGASPRPARATLPEMTRRAAKHLCVLEEGGLVVTRRAGRSKLHFLNPVPIRLIHDRWIPATAPRWERSPALKAELERETDAADRRCSRRSCPRLSA